jgi:hypothetical protein
MVLEHKWGGNSPLRNYADWRINMNHTPIRTVIATLAFWLGMHCSAGPISTSDAGAQTEPDPQTKDCAALGKGTFKATRMVCVAACDPDAEMVTFCSQVARPMGSCIASIASGSLYWLPSLVDYRPEFRACDGNETEKVEAARQNR